MAVRVLWALCALLFCASFAAAEAPKQYSRIQKLAIIAALACESPTRPWTSREIWTDQTVPLPRDGRICAAIKDPYGFGVITARNLMLFAAPTTRFCERYDIIVVSLTTGEIGGVVCGDFLMMVEFVARKGTGILSTDPALPRLFEEHLKKVWPWFREEYEKRRLRASFQQ